MNIVDDISLVISENSEDMNIIHDEETRVYDILSFSKKIPITNEIINLINFNEYINKLYEKSIKDIVDALNKK